MVEIVRFDRLSSALQSLRELGFVRRAMVYESRFL